MLDLNNKKISDLVKKDDVLLANKYGILPDPDFSPERNQQVINASIQKHEAKQALKMKLWQETMRERAEAVAMFLKHVDRGKDNNVVKYFGRQELGRLRGEEIATQLKGLVSKHAKTQ